MSKDLKVHAILVAANADGEDLLPEPNADIVNPLILEDGYRCPPDCPPPSVLNGD
jgi:hypothetical protein